MNIAKVRTALLCGVLVVAMALCACGNAASPKGGSTKKKQASAPASIEGLQTDGVLTVGILSSSTTPFVMEMSTSTTGLDIDLAHSLANELGLKVAFVTVEDTLDGLAQGCDVVMNATADKNKDFEVIGHYADSATAFFHKGPTTVVKSDDLKDKSVGVQDSSSAQRALRITDFNASENSYRNLGRAFGALEVGTIDYVLCHTTTGAYLCTRYKDASFAGTLSEPVANGIAVVNSNDSVCKAVREGYERLEKNGVLAEVRRCWLGDMPLLSSKSQIAGIPMKKTTGESLESLSADVEAINTRMDGSTAGVNAVTP